jgi:glycosyltransferase involved in cell wall biosynthesis
MDRSDKIILFSMSVSTGGAERVMLLISEGLIKKGYPIELVIKNDVKDGRFYVPPEVPVTVLNARGLVDTTFKFRTYLRKNRPKLVIAALETLGLATLLNRKWSGVDFKAVPAVHLALARHYAVNQDRHNRWQRKMVAKFYPQADQIVAVSDGVAKDLLTFVNTDRSKVKTLYNPVISNRELQMMQQPVDHPWLKDGSFVAISVGRMTRQKDFPMLLEAIKIARQKIDVKLILLGEGDDRAMIERKAVDLGIQQFVQMPGFVENPLCYIKNSSVYVLSSGWEGLPTVVIESLACGTKVVATDCDAGPDEILAGGRYGILTPVSDAQKLAQGIIDVHEGRGVIPPPESWAPYTLDRAIEGYAKLIDELLA